MLQFWLINNFGDPAWIQIRIPSYLVSAVLGCYLPPFAVDLPCTVIFWVAGIVCLCSRSRSAQWHSAFWRLFFQKFYGPWIGSGISWGSSSEKLWVRSFWVAYSFCCWPRCLWLRVCLVVMNYGLQKAKGSSPIGSSGHPLAQNQLHLKISSNDQG